MDNDQNLDDLLVKAYDAAPVQIQAFLDDERLADFMIHLQMTKKMQVDVAGEVSNRILLTLLGVLSPNELPAELKAAGVPDEQVDEVLKAANDAIFLPLREEMRNAPQTPAPQQIPTQAPSSPQAPLVSVPTPIAMPQAPVLQPVQPAAPAYAPPTPQPVAPIYTPLAQPPMASEPYIPPAPPVAMPVARTMAHDVEAMKDGHQPTAWAPPVPAQNPPAAFSVPTSFPQPQAPAAYQAPQVAPSAPVFTPMPNPVAAPAPQPPRPAYVPPPINALRTEPVAPKQPAADTLPQRKEITDTLKQYGIDPYHEPLD